MEYHPSDNSGTYDNLPPSHQSRGLKYRTAASAIPYHRMQSDMETQIHRTEQEAYFSVLRAFKAQSDAITWEKESLITNLRKELRVSDNEHRELLSKVNADDMIQKIREWRKNGETQSGVLNNACKQVPNSSVSAPCKRKSSQSQPSLSMGLPSCISADKKDAISDIKSKKLKTGQSLPLGSSSMKSLQHPLQGQSGRGQAPNMSSSGALAANVPTGGTPFDNLIGRKVLTRWPDDNNFYEAVITDFDYIKGAHLLVYDINTNNETWEWVNLKEISPEDIRWEGEDPGIISHGISRDAASRGANKLTGRGNTIIPGAGRGRGSLKDQSKKEFPSSQNRIRKKRSGDIELLHTDILLKEVERVLYESHPDLLKLEKAKEVLKDHEQSLIDAITMLVNVSDGESDDGEQLRSYVGQTAERDLRMTKA